MPDREKVIKGLDALSKAMHKNQCYACSYEFIEATQEFGTNIIENAIALLKERNDGKRRECTKPVTGSATDWEGIKCE